LTRDQVGSAAAIAHRLIQALAAQQPYIILADLAMQGSPYARQLGFGSQPQRTLKGQITFNTTQVGTRAPLGLGAQCATM
jgi:hypothetical protein